MSHLKTSEVTITDLSILKKVIATLFPRLKWNEGQKEFLWYANKKGKCEHAISYDGLDDNGRKGGYNYEIGVIRTKDGEGWKLSFDPYDYNLAEIVGRTCEKIIAAYSEEFACDFAARNGFIMDRTTDDEGKVVITMTEA